MATAMTVIEQEYVPLEKAIVTLGRSERSVQRLAKAGKVRYREGKEGREYHVGDLLHAKENHVPAGREEAERSVTTTAPLRHVTVEVADKISDGLKSPVSFAPEVMDVLKQFVELLQGRGPRLLEAGRPQALEMEYPPDVESEPPGVPVTQKLWLRVREARQLGIGRTKLMELIGAGKVQAYRDSKGWLVRRVSLEGWDGSDGRGDDEGAGRTARPRVAGDRARLLAPGQTDPRGTAALCAAELRSSEATGDA